MDLNVNLILETIYYFCNFSSSLLARNKVKSLPGVVPQPLYLLNFVFALFILGHPFSKKFDVVFH